MHLITLTKKKTSGTEMILSRHFLDFAQLLAKLQGSVVDDNRVCEMNCK